MPTYKVILNGRPDEYVTADRYRREGEQYVFEKDGDSEVQFFLVSAVVGIFVEPEPPPASKPWGY